MMSSISQLKITGKKVLLVGFWGNKNMGDELILLWNIKILLAQGKEVFVISQNTPFLKKFLWQFINIQEITFLQELPRWLRSGIKYFFCYLFQLKYFFQCDEIILWGWEILTEENKNSYRYWLWSIWPALYLKNTNLIIMWGVQVPEQKKNLKLFKKILSYTKHIYVRDFQALENLKKFGYQKVNFFMDTSYFAEDWEKYKLCTNKNVSKKISKYIIVNLNSNWEKFLGDIVSDIVEYVRQWYRIYYVPICTGYDDDKKYFKKLQNKLSESADIKILERENNFKNFLKILWWAEKVIGTRLHLYLISKFIGLDTIVYPYQRKIIRMQEVLAKLDI